MLYREYVIIDSFTIEIIFKNIFNILAYVFSGVNKSLILMMHGIIFEIISQEEKHKSKTIQKN